jgi:hypothetical protein
VIVATTNYDRHRLDCAQEYLNFLLKCGASPEEVTFTISDFQSGFNEGVRYCNKEMPEFVYYCAICDHLYVKKFNDAHVGHSPEDLGQL